MSLTYKHIEIYSEKLINESRLVKKPTIDTIISIITPHLRDSGFIDDSNYVNGFRPKDQERKYIQIIELPEDIYIPQCLVELDAVLSHNSTDGKIFKTKHLSCNGLYLDMSFSDFYSHSLEILEVILLQLRSFDI